MQKKDPCSYSQRAIGIIDSGVGGLTVVKEVTRLLPHEKIIYFGDTARMPYGPRPHEEVRRFTAEMITFLKHQDIKMIIVACNSASAAGLDYYREFCSMPIVGVIEPGVTAAIAASKNGRIGVIGTTGTIDSGEYEKALLSREPGFKVYSKACPLFVLLVENNLVNTREAFTITEQYLDNLLAENIDTLILGCTHYPLMTELIQKVTGPSVKLINSAYEVAIEAEKTLLAMNLDNNIKKEELAESFFVSGNPASFAEIGSKLLERAIKAYQVFI